MNPHRRNKLYLLQGIEKNIRMISPRSNSSDDRTPTLTPSLVVRTEDNRPLTMDGQCRMTLALTITSYDKRSPSKHNRFTQKPLKPTLVQCRVNHIQQQRSSLVFEPHDETPKRVFVLRFAFYSQGVLCLCLLRHAILLNKLTLILAFSDESHPAVSDIALRRNDG